VEQSELSYQILADVDKYLRGST